MTCEAGRAFVNGIHIYYEVHGGHDRIPLVLLHGGGSTIDSNFGRVIPFLAGTRRVKDAFLAVNPDSRKLKTMHDKDAARMAGFRDVPDAAVRGVRAPTLIISGDRDVARLEHAIELTRLFPDARLLVLPGGHGDYLAEASSAPADRDYAEISARLIDRFRAVP